LFGFYFYEQIHARYWWRGHDENNATIKLRNNLKIKAEKLSKGELSILMSFPMHIGWCNHEIASSCINKSRAMVRMVSMSGIY
jgi:hypothetical protein